MSDLDVNGDGHSDTGHPAEDAHIYQTVIARLNVSNCSNELNGHRCDSCQLCLETSLALIIDVMHLGIVMTDRQAIDMLVSFECRLNEFMDTARSVTNRYLALDELYKKPVSEMMEQMEYMMKLDQNYIVYILYIINTALNLFSADPDSTMTIERVTRLSRRVINSDRFLHNRKIPLKHAWNFINATGRNTLAYVRFMRKGMSRRQIAEFLE
jgi:hypothetical protein